MMVILRRRTRGDVLSQLRCSSKTTVCSQFGAVADAYATSEIHARGESLAVLVEYVEPRSGWSVLDVATGAGHTALAIAPYVLRVVATDVTPQMVAKTAELAAARGLNNLEMACADAEQLPFASASFDLLTCRLAFHHFGRPVEVVREWVRVLKPGGILGFTDNVSVSDPFATRYYNAYEALRDPSHHWVFALADLRAMFTAAGLQVRQVCQLSKELEFHSWADRQRVSLANKARLLHMMHHLPPTLQPLLSPRWSDGTLYFKLWEAVVVAYKPGGTYL